MLDLKVQAREAQLTLKSSHVIYHLLKNSRLGAKNVITLAATERDSEQRAQPNTIILDPFIGPCGFP